MPVVNFSENDTRQSDLPYYTQRVDLACAFRWAYRLGMYEAVANHFSVAVSEDGKQFLMNPDKRHFALIKASEMLLLDSDDDTVLDSAEAPDVTAWYLHAAVHKICRHARCILHVHSIYATVLASLQDSGMPPIDQNTAMFYQRVCIDENYGGLALKHEGERCAALLEAHKKIMVMGNHGVMAVGESVADAFFQLYYFERAAETLIKAYQTGKPLRLLSDNIAAKTADEIENYQGSQEKFFTQLKEILDKDGDDFRQ